LLACLACDLFISFGCIYFGKCRKECRRQRVADSTGETTATLGCVSKLRGSHRHHLLCYGNNAFLRGGPKVNLFKTGHAAILLCLDFSSRVASRSPHLATEFHPAPDVEARPRDLKPTRNPAHRSNRCTPRIGKMFGLGDAPTIDALPEHRPARYRFNESNDAQVIYGREDVRKRVPCRIKARTEGVGKSS
jgi:hypothetical protein